MFASWPLLAGVFVVWCLWAIAASIQRAAEDARKGIPKEQRGGVSILPVIPLNPLVLWGVACLIDDFSSPWGTLIVGTGHGVFAAFLFVSIVRDWMCLRSIDKQV